MNRVIHLLPLDRNEIEDESFHGRITALGNIYNKSEITNEEIMKRIQENKSNFKFFPVDNFNLTNLSAYMSPYKERLGIKAQSQLVFPYSNPEYYYQNRSSHYFFLFKKRLLSIHKERIKNNKLSSSSVNAFPNTLNAKLSDNKSNVESDYDKSILSNDQSKAQKDSRRRKISNLMKTQTIKNDLSYNIIQDKIINDYSNLSINFNQASQPASRGSFHKTKFSTCNYSPKKSSLLKELHDIKHKIAKDTNKKYLLNISFLKRGDKTNHKTVYQYSKHSWTKGIKLNLFNKNSNKFKDNSKKCINSLIDGCEKIRSNTSDEISGFKLNMTRKHEIFNQTCKIIRSIDAGDINTLKNLYNYQKKKEDEEISDLHKLYSILKEELSNPLRIAAKLEKQKSSDIRKRKAKKSISKSVALK